MNVKEYAHRYYVCGECDNKYVDIEKAEECCHTVPCGRCGKDISKSPPNSSASPLHSHCRALNRLERAEKKTYQEFIEGDYMIFYNDEYYYDPQDLIDSIVCSAEVWEILAPRLVWLAEPEEFAPDIESWLQHELYEYTGGCDRLDHVEIDGLKDIVEVFNDMMIDNQVPILYRQSKFAFDITGCWEDERESLRRDGFTIVYEE